MSAQRTRNRRAPGQRLRWSAAMVAGLLAVIVAAATHYVDGWQLCETARTGHSPTTTRERVRQFDGPGDQGRSELRETSVKTTTASKSADRTESCRGASPGELAPLLLPTAILLLPDIRSLDLGGVFKLQLRELRSSLEATREGVREVRDVLSVVLNQEQNVNVNVGQTLNVGQSLERAVAEAERDDVIPVDELEEE